MVLVVASADQERVLDSLSVAGETSAAVVGTIQPAGEICTEMYRKDSSLCYFKTYFRSSEK